MNTKRNALVAGILLLLLLTSACAGAAATQAPDRPQQRDYQPQGPAATEAPVATEASAIEAPAYDPESSSPLFSPTYTAPCLLYTSPSPRDGLLSRMPSSA